MSRLLQLLSPRSWPSQCLICRAWPAQSLCRACIRRFARSPSRCRCCALPVPEGVDTCGDCLLRPPPLERCVTALAYAWPWSLCITRLKFHQDIGLAAALAGLMQQAPGVAELLDDADWLVPLPLSPQRLAERGYNPAQLLARRLNRHACRDGLLLRTRHTPPQSGLPRAERLRNVRHAFAVPDTAEADVTGRHIVLVDDVMTTGASLHEAARALLAAGAHAVSALVLARTGT